MTCDIGGGGTIYAWDMASTCDIGENKARKHETLPFFCLFFLICFKKSTCDIGDPQSRAPVV